MKNFLKVLLLGTVLTGISALAYAATQMTTTAAATQAGATAATKAAVTTATTKTATTAVTPASATAAWVSGEGMTAGERLLTAPARAAVNVAHGVGSTVVDGVKTVGGAVVSGAETAGGAVVSGVKATSDGIVAVTDWLAYDVAGIQPTVKAAAGAATQAATTAATQATTAAAQTATTAATQATTAAAQTATTAATTGSLIPSGSSAAFKTVNVSSAEPGRFVPLSSLESELTGGATHLDTVTGSFVTASQSASDLASQGYMLHMVGEQSVDPLAGVSDSVTEAAFSRALSGDVDGAADMLVGARMQAAATPTTAAGASTPSSAAPASSSTTVTTSTTTTKTSTTSSQAVAGSVSANLAAGSAGVTQGLTELEIKAVSVAASAYQAAANRAGEALSSALSGRVLGAAEQTVANTMLNAQALERGKDLIAAAIQVGSMDGITDAVKAATASQTKAIATGLKGMSNETGLAQKAVTSTLESGGLQAGSEKVADLAAKGADQAATVTTEGAALRTLELLKSETTISYNVAEYALVIAEQMEADKTTKVTHEVKVKAEDFQGSQGQQFESKLVPVESKPMTATTVGDAAASLISLLNNSKIDLSLLSMDMKDGSSSGQSTPAARGYSSQASSGDGTTTSTTATTPTSRSAALTLTTRERREIKKRRSLLLGEWAAAAAQIGEGSNAISQAFYDRVDDFVDAANAAQGTLGGMSAMNDSDRFVLFEITRGAALSAIGLGLQGATNLSDLEEVFATAAADAATNTSTEN